MLCAQLNEVRKVLTDDCRVKALRTLCVERPSSLKLELRMSPAKPIDPSQARYRARQLYSLYSSSLG